MGTKRNPTKKEIKLAIDNILIHMSYLQQGLQKIDSALASYITYNKDGKKFGKWLEKKVKEESNGQTAGKSSEGNSKDKG